MAESFLMKLKASGLQFVKKEATGVFLWVLRNFRNTFYRTPSGGSFFYYAKILVCFSGKRITFSFENIWKLLKIKRNSVSAKMITVFREVAVYLMYLMNL